MAFTPLLNDFLGRELPICQLLDLGPGGIWESTHKFPAKFVKGNGPFCEGQKMAQHGPGLSIILASEPSRGP